MTFCAALDRLESGKFQSLSIKDLAFKEEERPNKYITNHFDLPSSGQLFSLVPPSSK